MESERLNDAVRSSTPHSLRKAPWTAGQVIQSLDEEEDPDEGWSIRERLWGEAMRERC